MSVDPNAKLRRLRGLVKLFAKCGEVSEADAGKFCGYIDTMLAEQCTVHPHGMWWTCERGTKGCTIAHSVEDGFAAIESGHAVDVGQWITEMGRESRRESLAEEVARLHGFVGPDGRGRP